MAHPIYKNKEGKKLPSVTTVINDRKEAGGLIHSAWQLGIEGKDYREEWGNKANSGTLVHSLIHEEAIDYNLYTPELVVKAQEGYKNYLKWKEQSHLVSVASEISLVCECHQTGGTIDDVFFHDGEWTIADIKTGKLYSDHLIQVACYGHLWSVNFPDSPISGFHLLHFDKENADFGHNYFTDLSDGWEAFIRMRELYDLNKKLKARV